MPYIRFKLDLAIKQPIPEALKKRLPAIKARILELKSYSEKINEKKENEEVTVNASYHICNHDIGEPCEKEVEIV